MWPDRVSNPGPPTYESDALPIALRGPASDAWKSIMVEFSNSKRGIYREVRVVFIEMEEFIREDMVYMPCAFNHRKLNRT